jgi:PPOX class probable F420-dependent enzyme
MDTRRTILSVSSGTTSPVPSSFLRTLDAEQIRAFLMEGTRTAKVAVVRKDGSPLVTPVWFLVESDGTIVFTTGKHTVKGRALEHDPRLSFCVADDRPPFAFVRVDGVAELSDDPADLKRWATRIAERYMGTERAQEFGERNSAPGEVVVRVRTTHVVGEAELAL